MSGRYTRFAEQFAKNRAAFSIFTMLVYLAALSNSGIWWGLCGKRFGNAFVEGSTASITFFFIEL